MTHRTRLAMTGLAMTLVAGCASLAVMSAPEKKPSAERTVAAVRADDLFWRTFHAGAYERIPEALTPLKAAYLADPTDAVTAAHIGWLHIWRLSERARLGAGAGPGITDDAVLARKYFEEAVRLNPREPRYLGFYASLLMTEGSIHRDEKLVRRGYFTMKDAVAAWPEFNYFTAGYGVSAQPHDSLRFREGIEAQWSNLDVCVGERVDREKPDYARYMKLETREGPKRVCWNSWIAPHNFEGFFLNFGDMLVKAGEPDRAVVMYRNAQLSREYASWPFKAALERRIAEARDNVAAFRRAEGASGDTAIMVRSTYACMGCHQQ
jgi:hypothetical protein